MAQPLGLPPLRHAGRRPRGWTRRVRQGGGSLALALGVMAVPLPPALAAADAPAPTTRPAPVTAPEANEPAAAPERPAAIRREIVLALGRREISLRENGQVVRRWPVAIGDPSTPTPLGSFKVENKVVNPRYQSTRSGKINDTVGPQGPLGDRWIGFKQSGANQYGIHGTPTAWAWTVNSRAAVSNGCVRMLTPHVRELFDKVEIGTPVIVTR